MKKKKMMIIIKKKKKKKKRLLSSKLAEIAIKSNLKNDTVCLNLCAVTYSRNLKAQIYLNI
jgi:hypothetical protein